MPTENFNAFHVTYHGPTNKKPGRIKIKSLRFHQYAWASISYHPSKEWYDDAEDHLTSLGFNMIGKAEYPGNGFLFFSNTFKPLK